MTKPNVLFVMCDQLRFDSIAALGNRDIHTPNIDRLVRRGISFSNGYSTCPVCIPARYTIRTGCEPPTTRSFCNGLIPAVEGLPESMEGRCGPYLARRMSSLGYRTFGVGKFHSVPWDEDLGYDAQEHSEEIYGSPDRRRGDAFASWIAREHPEFDFIETLMGERTEMYYMPQMSALPAELAVEHWAAQRAIHHMEQADERPFFGLVSFVGPHPPLAPPIPFNRMYDPDKMPDPVCGDLSVDHMDEQIPYMNQRIWAEDIPDAHARILRARYYGEISYIDQCLGLILDAVEKRPDADNTVICFFADHGDHMGDHHAWQKESFFEASCHVPFLVSWPAQLPAGEVRNDLVCLTDLFGIATHVAGQTEVRDGVDVMGTLKGDASARPHLAGYYGAPGTPVFKIMVRDADWKYIYIANGGREQLFDLTTDPNELENRAEGECDRVQRMREVAVEYCRRPGCMEALDGDDLRAFPFQERQRPRFYQFDGSRGVTGFPERPEDVLKDWSFRA